MALTPALRFDGVSYAYHAMPSPALAGVSFSLAAGERAALLGRNGAGKSTLVRLVTGLLQPAAGVIWVGDWDTRGRAPEELARRVASVFQHADQHPYDLPPAFRKLAALAGALALEPRLLVLDEPTAGLDRALRARVTAALLGRAASGTALLVVTHDLAFAAETLERGLVLDRGNLACDEPLEPLLGDAERLEPLGLAPPPVAALSVALDLPGRPVRARDAARALAVFAGRGHRP